MDRFMLLAFVILTAGALVQLYLPGGVRQVGS